MRNPQILLLALSLMQFLFRSSPSNLGFLVRLCALNVVEWKRLRVSEPSISVWCRFLLREGHGDAHTAMVPRYLDTPAFLTSIQLHLDIHIALVCSM